MELKYQDGLDAIASRLIEMNPRLRSLCDTRSRLERELEECKKEIYELSGKYGDDLESAKNLFAASIEHIANEQVNGRSTTKV